MNVLLLFFNIFIETSISINFYHQHRNYKAWCKRVNPQGQDLSPQEHVELEGDHKHAANCSLCICCGSKWNSCPNNTPLSPNNNSFSWIVTKDIENQSGVMNFILTHNISPSPNKFHFFHNSLVCIASSMWPCNNNNIEQSVTVTIHSLLQIYRFTHSSWKPGWRVTQSPA